MKRMILVLAMLLMVTTAFATVTITATQTPETGNVVISYSSDEPNAIRGLALDVTIVGVESSLGEPNISAVAPATTGETVSEGTRGFGIFPSTITIDENGDVTDDGVPVSPASMHADTKPGLVPDSNGVTIEMAALYDMDDVGTLAPAQSGTLCTVTATHDCNLAITTNNIRGGIVLNDGTYSQNADPCEALSVILPSTVEVRFEQEAPPSCYGDLDGNGYIFSNDMSAMIDYLVHIKDDINGGSSYYLPCTHAEFNPMYDMDGNGYIFSNDLSAMIDFLSTIKTGTGNFYWPCSSGDVPGYTIPAGWWPPSCP